ncbi:MAG: acetate/propionate family kinase [Candidatus Omnitrophica bacterium]|nr:acetate/propionate family kinase [Candidatus Omnitrophota bacterium]
MHYLVFNAGSSSLNYKVFNYQKAGKANVVFKGKAHRVGVKGVEPSFIENVYNGHSEKIQVPIADHKTAAVLASNYIKENKIPVDAVGHRFVHGGEYFKRSSLINAQSMKKIKECLPLAPLHNPISFNVIKESKKAFSHVPHYLVIDSAFHSSLPEKAYTYPLPKEIITQYKFRRFGFHGISYSYICDQLPSLLKKPLKKINAIICHLGTGGASVALIENGISIDTSMGFSPNSGLIMSTRSGDIDPMVILYLIQKCGLSAHQVETLLNNKSGLRGISGFSSDITDIIAKLKSKGFAKKAKLAFDMYIHRLKSYIGSYVMVLQGKIDALIFTDDIGVGNPLIRQEACQSLEWAGIFIDKTKNNKAPANVASFIQAQKSSVSIISMPTQEELMICLEGGRLLGGKNEKR